MQFSKLLTICIDKNLRGFNLKAPETGEETSRFDTLARADILELFEEVPNTTELQLRGFSFYAPLRG